MPLKILIIEDDEEMCEEMEPILRGFHYEVEVAHRASEGIEMIKKGAYQLALLDIKMPEMSGREVLHFVRANCPQLKVIVLTGSPLDSVGLESAEFGGELFNNADYVMNKPFDIEQLLSKIKELLGA